MRKVGKGPGGRPIRRRWKQCKTVSTDGLLESTSYVDRAHAVMISISIELFKSPKTDAVISRGGLIEPAHHRDN